MSDTTTPALDRSLVRGIAWTGGVRWPAQIVTWGATLVVARSLTPADYGLVGMALIAVGMAQLVGEADELSAARLERIGYLGRPVRRARGPGGARRGGFSVATRSA